MAGRGDKKFERISMTVKSFFAACLLTALAVSISLFAAANTGPSPHAPSVRSIEVLHDDLPYAPARLAGLC